MATLAFLIGIYSYLILALGLLGWLYKLPVFLITTPFLLYAISQFNKLKCKKFFVRLCQEIKKDKLVALSVLLLTVQFLINLVGAVSPELSFDALFYHLPPPKLYVSFHRIFHIPGGLLFISALPRLTEMLYTVALLFGNEIWAKLIHFTFGVLASFVLFRLMRRYFSVRISAFGVLTFYTMLVVGWQSTTAYVDLARTFFEILALSLFLQWIDSRKDSFLYEAAIMTGLAIATKILAFGSLFTFLILILLLAKKGRILKAFYFSLLSLFVVLPWFILAYINTGSLLFPLLESDKTPGVVSEGVSFFSLLITQIVNLPFRLWKATLYPDDIISPTFLLFLPLVLISIWKQKKAIKYTALYVLLGFFFSPLASNRYLLPYLAGATLVVFSIFNYSWDKESLFKKLLIFIVFFGVFLNLGSRVLATRKFIPYLMGKQTKNEFLSQNLNFSFGDFYDVDGWFARNIGKDHLVLIYDVHNLYYVDFPYVHESWAESGTFFTHILVGNGNFLPKKFGDKPLIYENKKTGVRVYLFGEKL